MASASGLLYHNLFFRVENPSHLRFRVWKNEGDIDIQIGELPATPTEINARWDSPNIAQGTFEQLRGLDLRLRPAVYQIGFYGVPGKPASANFDVILEQEIERFPRLYDIGIQLLVISIPLIITSFFA